MAKSRPPALQSEEDTPEVYDSPWKKALRRYFEPFLKLLFPQVWQEIDWSREFEFLDKELDQALGHARRGRRRVDLLVRVHTISGAETWVLVHVEVQSQYDARFAARMLTYYHSLSQRYERPICSLAVLADNRPGWRPSGHATELWGCRCEFQFPVAKLLDFSARDLAGSDNPFAVFVRAHLATLEATSNSDRRREAKFAIVRSLYRQGWSAEDVRELFGLVDWVMKLSNHQNEKFWDQLMKFEKEKKMPYVTSIERMALRKGREEGREEGRVEGRLEGREEGREEGRIEGREEGREEGRIEGLRQSLLAVLETRFGVVPEEDRLWISQLPLQELESVLRRSVVASSLSELR